MVIFDTNMILRYILNDDKTMADKAEEYINDDVVLVTLEVIAEVVYVLDGVYKMNRARIAESIALFLELVDCNEKAVLHIALDAYASNRLDFVDCVLYAYNKVKHIEIATFDKKLLRLLAN